MALAALTLDQDASGALATALAGTAPGDPAARRVWIVDPAGEGLLLQFGATPTGLAAVMVLRPFSRLLGRHAHRGRAPRLLRGLRRRPGGGAARARDPQTPSAEAVVGTARRRANRTHRP